jgi:muramoyltetrapeptide carboxypeptidase
MKISLPTKTRKMYLCHMTEIIPPLHRGDLIRIVAPAKAIDSESIYFAKAFLETQGYEVKIGQHTRGRFNYLSGTDAERLADLQEALDDPDCSAILCARGGYGSIRIVDKLNWAGFVLQPKWLIGFSDITIFHNHIQALGLPSLHATMPLNFQKNSKDSLKSLLDVLSGKSLRYAYPATDGFFKAGVAKGTLVGGNLAVLHALMGTPKQPEFRGAILFIEDIGEHLYAIDRMLYSLELAGVFDKISGLILGGMTQISDTNPPLGYSLEEIIHEKTWFRSFPVCMNFPAGHVDDNRALILGRPATLTVGDSVIFEQESW